MTLQDDIARSWFQPSVPTEAPQERARPAQHDAEPLTPAGQRSGPGPWAASPSTTSPSAASGGNAGPLTTRVAGELPLDEPRDAAPRSLAPGSLGVHPAAERVEVTQPYIPAIREHEPSFAKRPHPEAPASPEPAAPTATTPAPAPVPTELPTRDAGPGAVTAPTEAVTAPRKETPAEQPTTTSTPANPPKRRSLARRVVRTIIGPDLLRKDPPKKK